MSRKRIIVIACPCCEGKIELDVIGVVENPRCLTLVETTPDQVPPVKKGESAFKHAMDEME